MFIERDDSFDWNSDFLLNNPEFQLEEPTYHRYKNNVIIFSTRDYTEDNYEQSIYSFIVKDWYIGDETHGTHETHGICYFCSRGANGRMCSSPDMKNNINLCSKCVLKWEISQNMHRIKKNDNLFIIHDDRINRITISAIYIWDDNSIIYERVIVPIAQFDFKNALVLDSHYKCEDYCDLCYSYYGFEWNNDFFGEQAENICNNCFEYSRQILINDNYPKYLNIIYSQILDDSSSIIIKYLISLLCNPQPIISKSSF